MNITGKDDLLIQKLLLFYSNPLYLNIFTEIVVRGKHISLRLLDFFSTNYTKKTKVYLNKNNCVDIYSDYKKHLKGFKKQYFDPFCRRKRVLLYSEECNLLKDNLMEKKSLNLKYKFCKNKKANSEIITTVGQLNFFKWCIEKGVIQYILQNNKIIEDNMTLTKLKLKAEKKKQQQTNISAN